MKIVGAVVVILLAIILYMVTCKVVCWMFDYDKKTDIKMFKTELEDYDNNKHCVVAGITVVFVVLTAWALFVIFTRW